MATYMNQYPDEKMLKKCRAILIPGSKGHLYNPTKHLIETEKWILEFSEDQRFKHVKILGICFGHQIIAKAFGATVQRRRGQGVEYVEEVQVKNEFWGLPFVKKSGIEYSDRINVLEFHFDEVKNLPTDIFTNYGFSESCEHEIFVSKDQRIMGMQGHPEYSVDYFFFRILRDYPHKNEEELSRHIEQYRKYCYHKASLNDYLFRYVCYSFLKEESVL